LLEAQWKQIEKKTAELNDGTGLTSSDLGNLQNEIAGHEAHASERRETVLEQTETIETAEADLSSFDDRIAEVTAAGKEVQSAVKGRKAELRDLLETNAASAAESKSALPPALVAAFDANVEQGGTGAAVLTGPNCQACG